MELLILWMWGCCFCFCDIFIDWGNPSNNLSDYINRFGESQSPVGSRTSLVNLVTGVAFNLVL